MSLYDWIYSVYPPDSAINGRYGLLHIAVMLGLLALIVMISTFRHKDEYIRRRILLVLAVMILVFEVARRVINLSRGFDSPTSLAYILIPRPWCAISCWLTLIAVLAKKKYLYNFCTMNSLLCAIVFFAHPNVGFNHRVILFENLYSIATHGLLLLSSVSMMTLGFTDFRLDKTEIQKTLALLASVFAYAAAEILLGIESDPLMFLPGNDVQDFLGVNYPVFLAIYFCFLTVWFSSFYLVQNSVHHRHHPRQTTVSA